jgi:3-oxoacyl-[acyl-carrier protein] reductase
MDLGLKGMRALVTGSSRGLGFATALELVREGAQVAINSRDADRLSAAADRIRAETGVQPESVVGDVSIPETSQRIVEHSARSLGGLDLLVTNAGGPPTGGFEAFDDQTWQRAVELSFLSHVLLIRAALPFLLASRAASVLTVTSVSVKQPIADLILSSSVRSATIGLTKSMALEFGAQGIRFNSILPSWTETERVGEIMASRALKHGTSVAEESHRQASGSVLGRMGQPEEFARVAVFLLSPAASYLTGVMLPVDGGVYKGVF